MIKSLKARVQLSPSLAMVILGLVAAIIFRATSGTPVIVRNSSKFSFLSRLYEPSSWSTILTTSTDCRHGLRDHELASLAGYSHAA